MTDAESTEKSDEEHSQQSGSSDEEHSQQSGSSDEEHSQQSGSSDDRRRRPPEGQHGGQAPPDRRRQNRSSGNEQSQKEKMLRYLYWGGFGFLCLFGAFAAISFYLSVMDIIDIWVSSDFKPIFRMLFNLAVILITVLGLSVLVRRYDVVFSSSEDS